MRAIDRATAETLIDFSGGAKELETLAQLQLDGAVALHNMLERQNMAYLADEVGMGKTYIALGVVALMRRFMPGLRVLYLLPKNNVRDKWEKDYRSFVEQNYRVRDLCVKGLNDLPAARYIVSHNLHELIQSVATDSARDFFICSSAFSFSLGNTAAELKHSLDRLRELLPQNRQLVEELRHKIERAGELKGAALADRKREVKQCWATALNAILPRFDLVVVDEAHNFRRSTSSSDRNQLLAAVLGAGDGERCKAQRILLLSATPFDRDINQLRNQLALFGKDALLTITNKTSRDDTHRALANFMVRRLNTIEIDGCRYTRNMYRDEHRSGQRAEIQLQLDQQLFAALLQKKVSESLQENCAGRFELGMLSSFESYLPGEKGKPIQFDGQDEHDSAPEIGERDARDRNIVEALVEDYIDTFGDAPPHPKMDAVAASAHCSGFEIGKKQLIFVRRVRSVAELKFKIESAYNEWLGRRIESDPAVKYWFDQYRNMTRKPEQSLMEEASGDETAEASQSSFFAWFYRGRNAELDRPGTPDLGQVPFNFRNMLASTSMMFETNWATLPGMPPARELSIDWSSYIPRTKTSLTPQDRFRHAQYAYLKAVAIAPDEKASKVAMTILEVAFRHFTPGLDIADPSTLANDLAQPTLWNRLSQSEELAQLYPEWGCAAFVALADDDPKGREQFLKRLLIHQELVGVICRLDHPFIDLYSLRHVRKEGGTGTADRQLIDAFIGLLLRQKSEGTPFSSYQILCDVAENLDLLIKLNFQDAYHKSASELTKYLAAQLNPLAPVVGATGETSKNRSAIARKFRMPGYPCVLISTDVFQEGEDLHTFCDHVVHYGISASPIALEQKIGRVDRVASLAHRSLRAAQENHAAHFIQVTYPYIRESLEFLQVRQASSNLNQFHRSLHRIGAEEQRYTAEVDINKQLCDESAVEGQIRDELSSPFNAKQEDLAGESMIALIKQERETMEKRLQHVQCRVQTCLSNELGQDVALTEGTDGLWWQSKDLPALTVQLRSAVGRPELLLAVSCRSDRPFDEAAAKSTECLSYVRTLQQDAQARLQLIDSRESGVILVRNVEIYAGTEHILVDAEVRDTFHRVANQNTIGWNSNPGQPICIDELFDGLCGNFGAYRICRTGKERLKYQFEVEGRQQEVDWSLTGSHVLITSQILSPEQTLELQRHPEVLIACTLRRNARFDVIDFHINGDNALAVRAMHPVSHLNHVELAFVSLSVAAEADRLQHVLLCGADDDEPEPGEEPVRGQSEDSPPHRIDVGDLMCTIRDLLQNGAMQKEELVRQIAYGLGYQRIGKNISATVEAYLRAAARRGIAQTVNGEIGLVAKSISEYARDFLKNQFLAALSAESAGFVHRDTAIRALARWMGFARTGPVIHETAKSLINGLLRENRLEARGQEIRRWR